MVQRKGMFVGADMERGKVKIEFLRSGTAEEIREFLVSFEDVYKDYFKVLEVLERYEYLEEFILEYGPPRIFRDYWGCFLDYPVIEDKFDIYSIDPRMILEISRVKMSSPGFWEFVGALNPLEFIRKMLQDRHNRIIERERFVTEKEKMVIEAEILIEDLNMRKIDRAYKMIHLMRELGFSESYIKRKISRDLLKSFHRLGKHQDNGLIK